MIYFRGIIPKWPQDSGYSSELLKFARKNGGNSGNYSKTRMNPWLGMATNKNRDDWGMVFGYVMMVMVMFLFLMVDGNDYNWYNMG